MGLKPDETERDEEEDTSTNEGWEKEDEIACMDDEKAIWPEETANDEAALEDNV